MEPWLTNRRVMTWLSMIPVDESTSKKERIRYVAFTAIVATITSCSLCTSFLLVLFYLPIDFETCVYAIFQVAAEANVLSLLIVALVRRHHIASVFAKLSEIHSASNDLNFH